MTWEASSSSDPRALAVVDGLGEWAGHGAHYSRRSPGSRTFTGVGQELVLFRPGAVFAVVRQRTPAARGTGSSRGRSGVTDASPRYVWRNMLFRNLSTELSSALIVEATLKVYSMWPEKYGAMPPERLRTEVDASRIRSSNPGCCYRKAGWTPWKTVGSKLYLVAPCPDCCLSHKRCNHGPA